MSSDMRRWLVINYTSQKESPENSTFPFPEENAIKLFYEENDQHPIIIFQDVEFRDLKAAVDFMYKGEIQIPQERVGSLLEIAQTLQIGGMCSEKEIKESVRVKTVSTGSDGVPSVPRISLRKDLLVTSERRVEKSIAFPRDKCLNSDTGLYDQSSQLQVSKREPRDPPLLLSSQFNEASSSSLFLPYLKNDSLRDCEEIFEVDTLLDNPDDRKDVMSNVDIVDHSIVEGAPNQFRRERLGTISCGSSVLPLLPRKIRAKGTKKTSEIPTPGKGIPCSVNKGKGSPDGPEGCMEVEGVPENVMHSFCKKTAGERNLKKRREVQSPSAGAAGRRGGSTSSCCEPSLPEKPLPRRSRTHLARKRHDCNVCKKVFYKKNHLDSHMYTHTGEMPFQCSVCGKNFSWKQSVTQHALAYRRKALRMFYMQKDLFIHR